MSPVISISLDCYESLFDLPKAIQVKIKPFVKKFMVDPRFPGLHLEKLNYGDKKMYSARIDQTYRAILSKEDESNTYILLWVDHHDEAYSWASKRKCEVNPHTGVMQVYSVEHEDNPSLLFDKANAGPRGSGPFALCSDSDLIELGVPESLLKIVKGYKTEADFQSAKTELPADCFENLSWIVNDVPMGEVIELVRSQRESADASGIGDFAVALSNPTSQRSFIVISGEDELEKVLSGPLPAWRIFLHPSQRALVDQNYIGPARVMGSAGTGKTVVAMHRARRLASELSPGQAILFTTFSTTLAADIKSSLKAICSPEEYKRIEVSNLDSWVAGYLSQSNMGYSIEYDESRLRELWRRAARNVGYDGVLRADYLLAEWRQVIVAGDIRSLASYAQVKRVGRQTRLSRKERIEVWKIVEEYKTLTKEERVCDIDLAMMLVRDAIVGQSGTGLYPHVIVDEGQDFSPTAFRLLRAVAGEAHSNDMFIVGDPRQRIYGKIAVLSRCGIEIRGRSRILRINYRTTEEIRRKAEAALEGIPFDDLDGGSLDNLPVQSLIRGEIPNIIRCKNEDEEIDAIAKRLEDVEKRFGCLSSTCIVARANRAVDEIASSLSGKGVRCLKLKDSKVDNQEEPGVRIATMHRVKGLEFDSVIIAGASKENLPPKVLLQNAKHNNSIEEIVREERSLLYVAMTRAKHELTIIYAGSPSPLIAEL